MGRAMLLQIHKAFAIPFPSALKEEEVNQEHVLPVLELVVFVSTVICIKDCDFIIRCIK